jgi:hypothetical protein
VKLEIGTDFYILVDETSVRITGLKTTKKAGNCVHLPSSVLIKRPAISCDAVTRYYTAP